VKNIPTFPPANQHISADSLSSPKTVEEFSPYAIPEIHALAMTYRPEKKKKMGRRRRRRRSRRGRKRRRGRRREGNRRSRQ